jgi:hypothetical protein
MWLMWGARLRLRVLLSRDANMPIAQSLTFTISITESKPFTLA